MSCQGRLVYRGLSNSLEIYPTPSSLTKPPPIGNTSSSSRSMKSQNYPTLNRNSNDVIGWSVRTKQPLKEGEFVCEFIGRISPAERKDIATSLAENDRYIYYATLRNKKHALCMTYKSVFFILFFVVFF